MSRASGTMVSFDKSNDIFDRVCFSGIRRKHARVFDLVVTKAGICQIDKCIPDATGGSADTQVAMTQSFGAEATSTSAAGEEDDDGDGDSDPDGRSVSQRHLIRSSFSASLGVNIARHRLIKLPEVINRTGLGRSSIYQKIKEKHFPPSVSIGARSIAWLESDVDDWINACVATRGV